jgi:hypothetical protein
MTAVKISIAIALFLDLIWAIIWLLQIGLDGRQMNRRIKDADHPSPDELRNRAVMIGQLALMGMVNVMAGALAGIGSSLFVDEGRLRWPSSQAPYALIILAVSLTVFSGVIIAAYITRPARKWVWDTSDFRSYLRQIKREGVVSETELVEIRERRERWEKHTNVRPLRNPEQLRALGLKLPKAREEWASSAPNDTVEFGILLRDDVTHKQVWLWIWRRRLWQLGVPPFIAGCTIALIIVGRLALILPSVPLLFRWLLLIVVAVICIRSIYWLAFRVGRLDLVMTNRYLALERKQLSDCDRLIGQIKESHRRQHEYTSLTEANGSSDKLVLRIGRWDLCRHN